MAKPNPIKRGDIISKKDLFPIKDYAKSMKKLCKKQLKLELKLLNRLNELDYKSKIKRLK